MVSASENSIRSLRRLLTNFSVVIFTLSVLLAGIILFALAAYLKSRFGVELPGWVGVTLEQLAGVFIATAVLSVFWEIGGKRALAGEVMETANLAQETREAGLLRVWNKYLPDELWQERFRRAQRLDVFVAYANTWRETYRNEISAFAKTRGQEIRIILPDITDTPTIASIACRSGKSFEEVIRKVEEAFAKYKSLLEGGTNCQILAHRGPQAYAVYRFDSECIATLYRNNPAKTGTIPTLAFSGGTLGAFLDDDLNEVIKRARVLWPEDQSVDELPPR